MTPSRQSPNTCATCRARKVRCDGRKGTRSNCERLGFTCSYRVRPKSSVSQPPIRRRRAHAACSACHARRVRCNEERLNCQRCSKLGLNCSYPGPKSQLEVGGTSSASFETETDGTGNGQVGATTNEVPRDLAMLAFRVFFEKLHRIPVFAFLHRACIVEQYRNGLLDRALLMSIVGISSLLGDLGQDTGDLGETLVDKAATIVLDDMERPTVPRIQALILIVKYRALTKRFASVFMLSAIAVRFATGLRLNYEDSQLSFLARESCRRTMWSLYLIDSTLAAGYQDFALSLSEMINVDFPCHERNFEMDLPPGDGSDRREDSPLALILRLAQLRHRALQFTKKAVETRTPMIDVIAGKLNCQRELDTFREDLPAAYKLSKHNIMLHAYSTTLSVFVSLHATWHGVVCILNRLVLDGLVESLPREKIAELDLDFRTASEKRCLESPKAVTDMLSAVYSAQVDAVPLALDVAVCVYQCLRVMIRSYRTTTAGSEEIYEAMADRCQVGLRFLQSTFAPTPAVKAIIQDAETLVSEELASWQAATRQARDQKPTEPSSTHVQTRHVLSKHSLIGQIDIPSKADSFLLSPSTTETQVETARKSPAIDSNQVPSVASEMVYATQSNRARADGAAIVSGLVDDTSTLGGWDYDGIDASSYELPDLGLPDFGLDSSIFLPSDWARGMQSEF